MAFNPTDYFLNPTGLYALLSLIPLILIYLVRPKPQERKIPSLMFFMKDLGRENAFALFRTLFRDWLLVLQLLLLLLLSTALAKPYMTVSERSLAENAIVVLDVSASMQAPYKEGTRFEEALDLARKHLGSQNTLILAKSSPEVIYINEEASEIKKYLKKLKPTESRTALYSSLLTATDYVKGDKTKVTVISDFIDTDVEADLTTAKRALQSKGASVQFISLSSEVSNVGIIDAEIGDQETSIRIKNYNDRPETVGIQIGDLQDSIIIAPRQIEIYSFTTPAGLSKLTLDVNDDFTPDNELFLSAPQDRTLKVLFITNQEQKLPKSNLYIALDVIGRTTNYKMEFETMVPPKAHSINHNLIFIHEVDPKLLLPGTIKSIKERVASGATLVVLPQKNLEAIDFQNLLPIHIKAMDTVGSDIKNTLCPITQSRTSEECLTQDIGFGHAQEYLATEAISGTTVIANSKKDNSPIIAYKPHRGGHVLYYGLFDEKSSFRTNIYYPIFWKRFFDLVTGTQNVRDLNKDTGDSISLGSNEAVKTPDGRVVKELLRLEKKGIYQLKDKTISVNLLSEQESDISGVFTDQDNVAEESVEIEREVPKEVTNHFLFAVIGLLFLELFLVKFRGDL